MSSGVPTDVGLSELNKKLYAYLSQIMGIRAYDVMEPAVSINPDATVTEAAKVMDENDTGALVIVDGNRIIKGILTFKDIVTRVVARELDPNKVRVGDIMTENVYKVTADAPLDFIASIMLKYGVRRIPVVNRFGKLVGMVHVKDLMSFLGMQRDLMVRIISALEAELSKHAEEVKEKREGEEDESAMYV